MKVRRNIYINSERASSIEEDIVGLISKINMLCLMAEGISRSDDRTGMAVEEVGRQLDAQARKLLENWEMLSLASVPASNQADDVHEQPL